MYVENILDLSLDTKLILKDIQYMIIFNNYRIKLPVSYLGAQFQFNTLNNIQCWTITIIYYINAAIANAEE